MPKIPPLKHLTLKEIAELAREDIRTDNTTTKDGFDALREHEQAPAPMSPDDATCDAAHDGNTSFNPRGDGKAGGDSKIQIYWDDDGDHVVQIGRIQHYKQEDSAPLLIAEIERLRAVIADFCTTMMGIPYSLRKNAWALELFRIAAEVEP